MTFDWLSETMQQLPNGAFLMVQDNPMTIGWAQFGVLWGKLCATVYVRHSRYTHTLLEKSSTFTISVPALDTMRKELAFCGSRSGRDVNKCEAIGRFTVPTSYGTDNELSGCKYHIACRILHISELDEKTILDADLIARYYKDGDPHTMYIGEILGVSEEQNA